MSKTSVVIITGSNMNKISNKTFDLNVPPGCDHSYILEEFVEKNEIIYPYFDYCFAHEAVKLAVMDNVVLLLSRNVSIVALPSIISHYQNEKLKLYRNTFFNDESIFSIMNIEKQEDKIIYEGISSNRSRLEYDDLVKRKVMKTKM